MVSLVSGFPFPDHPLVFPQPDPRISSRKKDILIQKKVSKFSDRIFGYLEHSSHVSPRDQSLKAAAASISVLSVPVIARSQQFELRDGRAALYREAPQKH